MFKLESPKLESSTAIEMHLRWIIYPSKKKGWLTFQTFRFWVEPFHYDLKLVSDDVLSYLLPVNWRWLRFYTFESPVVLSKPNFEFEIMLTS